MMALTPFIQTAMLSLRCTSSAGISTPFCLGVKAPIIGVFLCSPFLRVALCRAFLIMVGRIGQPQGWPHPRRGSANLIRPATQRLAPVGGGYPFFRLGVPQ